MLLPCSRCRGWRTCTRGASWQGWSGQASLTGYLFLHVCPVVARRETEHPLRLQGADDAGVAFESATDLDPITEVFSDELGRRLAEPRRRLGEQERFM